MNDIGPGDWVEYVGAGRWSEFKKWVRRRVSGRPCGLTKGSIYQVQAVGNGTCQCGRRGGLSLVQVDNPDGFNGWCLFIFRPIYRPKAEIMQEITRMVGAPPHERQDA